MTTQASHRWNVLVQVRAGLLPGGAIRLARPGPVATAAPTGTALDSSPTPLLTATPGGP